MEQRAGARNGQVLLADDAEEPRPAVFERRRARLVRRLNTLDGGLSRFAVFSATGTDLMPGACIMFKKGASIRLPSSAGLPNGASVRCWVYPIGAE